MSPLPATPVSLPHLAGFPPIHDTTGAHQRYLRGLFAWLATGLLSLVLAAPVGADTLAAWDVSGLPGGSANFGPSPYAASIAAPNLTVGGLTRGAGVATTATAAARGWGGHDWQNTDSSSAISGSDYATFTVAANAGYQVSFSAISRFDYRRSSTGPASGVLQYQIGSGPFNDITTLSYSSSASSGASLGTIDLSGIGALQNVPAGTPVTFRIVNYGGTSSSGTWYLFDVANSTAADFQVEGTVSVDNSTPTPVNGACGPAHGLALSNAPTTGLCAAGTASAVIGGGPWSWSCVGTDGGGTTSCAASFSASPASTGFRDFAPIADAQVTQGTPNTNDGTKTSMYVASANGGSAQNQRIWTAFDLSGRIPPGAAVTSAKLRLYVFKADNEGDILPVAVHASNDDSWTETGITWNNQPAYDPSPLANGSLAANDANAWVEYDVTAHVVERLNASDHRINLMLKAATEGASQWASYAVDSKEFNTSYAPRLRVEYSGGAWPDDRINIIHVNDFHSRLTPHDLDFPDGPGEAPAFEKAGGAAYVASKLMSLKQANPHSLVLDAGDISEGGPLGDLRVNGGMVDYLTTLDAQLKSLGGRGIDAIVIGNHDVRDAQMLANMQNSGLPFLAVNMLHFGAAVPVPAPWPAANPFRPYVIINTTSSAGTPTKVAVLGYLTDDSAILSATTNTLISVKETRWSSTNADHVKLKDWVAYLRKPVAQGGEGADVVVLLSHIGHRRLNAGDEILLGDGDVAPPNLVVSGHWHTWGKTAWQPANLNYNTAVVEAASYGQYVGEVQLTPKGEYLSAQKHPVKPAEIPPNPAVQSLINTLVTEYDAQTGKACVLPPSVTGRASASQPCPLFHVVGYSAVDLKLDKDKWFTLSEFPWSGDNTAGEWIADATVWKLNQLGIAAQLALQSGGGVRRDVKAGPVTYLDIYETYPWTDDQIVVVTLTSADIWSYLEDHYVGSSISQGWRVTADDGQITAITYNGTPLSKTDTATTWQVAISEYMFLHDDWISESGGTFNFQAKPNTHHTQSIRDAVVEYTSQFTAATPMTIPGPRYVLNTELAGGFKAVVTMVADAENEPYFEGVFVRLLEALPETVARRNGYGLSNLVNADGSINPHHEFSETLLYRSHLGFPDGILKVGDIIEVWGEGGFFAGNPQLVDQETVYGPGQEFRLHGHDPALAQPDFKEKIADFFNEEHENRLVRFRALRTGDKTVRDTDGTSINVYKEGGYYTIGRLPGVNGDILELTGIQTQRTGGNPERRFRLREASVVPASGVGSGYLPYSAVNAITPNPVATGPITLTAYANDPAAGGSGTMSLVPVADAHVASGYPANNYGASTSMYVQSTTAGFGNERAWLRFDLTGLPAGAMVSASRLKLYQWANSGTPLAVAVHGSANTAWSESGITWNSQPAFDATALATQNVSARNTWYTWDLGSYANGKSAVSLVAKPATENANPASATYAFNAKEYGSYAPALEVDYTAPLSAAGVVAVRYFYRHAPDGLNWGPWTDAGAGSNPADGWRMVFGFPQGAGHYQFYSVATDNDGNVQPTPVMYQASVVYNPGLQPQTITFATPANRVLGGGAFALGAYASSGLAVSYTSLTTGVCAVAGDMVTLLAAGTCTLAADQAGNDAYAPAPREIRSFQVLLAQSIEFAPLVDRPLGSGSFALVATAVPSGLPVSFASATPSICTVAGASVTLVAAGTCTIVASQDGNANYAPAPDEARSFTVTGAVYVDDGDVPIPAWALLILGAGLLGAMGRRSGRA